MTQQFHTSTVFTSFAIKQSKQNSRFFIQQQTAAECRTFVTKAFMIRRRRAKKVLRL